LAVDDRHLLRPLCYVVEKVGRVCLEALNRKS
jgi:hypothetical protein